MKSLNRVELIGNLGRDAETKYTNSGDAVTNFSVATERRIKRGEEWVSETDWHACVLWRNEGLVPYMQKGKKVYVDGQLRTRSYETKEGDKRSVTEINVQNVILLGGSEGATPPMQSQPKGRPVDEKPFEADDDMVPF